MPTASGDDAWQLVRFYESFAHRAEASHISFNPWPRADIREHLLAQDAVCALRNYRKTRRTLAAELTRFPVARLRTSAEVDLPKRSVSIVTSVVART